LLQHSTLPPQIPNDRGFDQILQRIHGLIDVMVGSGAGEGNRTLVCSLGSCRSTIELRPRCFILPRRRVAMSSSGSMSAAIFDLEPPILRIESPIVSATLDAGGMTAHARTRGVRYLISLIQTL